MRTATGCDDGASSITVGFILQVGIMTAITVAVVLVLGGVFMDDVATEDELEAVGDQVLANMIEADRMAYEQSGVVFFQPPRSPVDYRAEFNETGGDTDLLIEGDGHLVAVDIGRMMTNELNVEDGSVVFFRTTENVVVEIERGSSPGDGRLNVSAQEDTVG